MKFKLTSILFLILIATACQQGNEEIPQGRLFTYESVLSKHIQPRNVTIWLPPGYQETGTNKYPVIYMHDGQNLFDTATGYGGKEWQVDETMAALIHEGEIEPAIVVGIWNTEKRTREYTPEKPFESLSDSVQQVLAERVDSEPLSDEYLEFVVKELKPFVDKNFHTKPGPRHTFTAGSSMGGLISLYALTEYPDVFGKAACISTHWPLGFEGGNFAFTNAMIEYLNNNYDALKGKELYFDFGTETLDSLYEPHQQKVDSFFRQKGFPTENITTKKFEGHKHHEDSWAERFDVIAKFLVGK